MFILVAIYCPLCLEFEKFLCVVYRTIMCSVKKPQHVNKLIEKIVLANDSEISQSL